MANETKTATHTPGPWHSNRISGAYSYQDVFHVEDEENVYICGVGMGAKADTDARMIANARLIAAAPELLEALIGVHSFEFPTTRPDSLCWCPPKWHDYPAGQQPPHSAQCQEAKDAIAKATGAQA